MRKKIIIVSMFSLAVIGAGLYFYMYKGHRNIASESADYSLTVKTLQQQFTQNSGKANKQYADKTIEVYGKITSLDLPSNTITLDGKLSAVFKDSSMTKLQVEKLIKIKGRFVGYDDLLDEFKMDQASLSE